MTLKAAAVRHPYYHDKPPAYWGDPADLDLMAGVSIAGYDRTAAHRATVRAANQQRQERERRQRAAVVALVDAAVVVGDMDTGGDVDLDGGVSGHDAR